MTEQQFYRLLAAAIESACNYGDTGNVVRAKSACRYDSKDIENLKTPKVIFGENIQFDTYWRLVVQSSDDAVKHLTGHARKWWLDLYHAIFPVLNGGRHDKV